MKWSIFTLAVLPKYLTNESKIYIFITKVHRVVHRIFFGFFEIFIFPTPGRYLQTAALKRAKWKPLSYIHKRRLASIMYQVHNDILPVQLRALLGTRSNETSYKLRRSNDFSLVHYHSELGRNSIRYRGPIVWNSIPKFIRNVTSLQLVKEKLKLASKTLDQIQFEKEACLIKSKDSAFLYF